MTLSPRAAYERWASSYDAETVVTVIEDGLAARLAPVPEGAVLLDAGCGTGRRLPPPAHCRAVGVDLVPAMLRAGHQGEGRLVAGDVRALPLADETFTHAWCRLALGHLAAVQPAYAELARTLRRGGTVLVTDFHPAAVAAGHRRSFRDAAGTVHDVEHHVHPVEAHVRAATAAGLSLAAEAEGTVGPEVRARYAAANRLPWYERDLGLPLVLGLRFVR